jgi:hypothetical protein
MVHHEGRFTWSVTPSTWTVESTESNPHSSVLYWHLDSSSQLEPARADKLHAYLLYRLQQVRPRGCSLSRLFKTLGDWRLAESSMFDRRFKLEYFGALFQSTIYNIRSSISTPSILCHTTARTLLMRIGAKIPSGEPRVLDSERRTYLKL